jgi:hypothetical protein
MMYGGHILRWTCMYIPVWRARQTGERQAVCEPSTSSLYRPEVMNWWKSHNLYRGATSAWRAGWDVRRKPTRAGSCQMLDQSKLINRPRNGTCRIVPGWILQCPGHQSACYSASMEYLLLCIKRRERCAIVSERARTLSTLYKSYLKVGVEAYLGLGSLG